MSEIKLKRCPFCGGKAEIISSLGEIHNYVMCMDCYCRTQVFTTKARAIERWNTRKPKQEIVERLEEYAKIAKEEYEVGMLAGFREAIEIVREVGGLDG